MKWNLPVIATTLYIYAACALAGQVHAQAPILPTPGYVSPNQAIQAVRDFEDDPGLAVKITDYPSTSSRLIDIGRHYVLTAGDFIYHVGYRYDTITREVELLPSGGRVTDQSSPTAAMGVEQPEDTDQSQAQAIAYQYMADHFPVPAVDMLLHDSSSTVSADQSGMQYPEYMFRYSVNAGNGFVGPASCIVVVESEGGQVSHYIGDDFPLLINTVAQLTPAQGIAAAAQAIGYVPDGMPSVTWAGVVPPDALGDEELFYDVSLPGYAYGSQTDWENWYVRVDANTGAILDISVEAAMRPNGSVDLTAAQVASVQRKTALPYPRIVGKQAGMTMLGRKGFLDRPALIVESDPYVYLGYAVAAASGSASLGAGGWMSVNAANHIVAFRPGVGSYTLDGQTRALDHLPIYTAGAYYIPIQLANAIAPGRFTYSAKSGAMDYRPAASAKLAAVTR